MPYFSTRAIIIFSYIFSVTDITLVAGFVNSLRGFLATHTLHTCVFLPTNVYLLKLECSPHSKYNERFIVDFMNKLLIYFVHSCHKAGSKISLSILQRNTNMKSFNKDNTSLLFKT